MKKLNLTKMYQLIDKMGLTNYDKLQLNFVFLNKDITRNLKEKDLFGKTLYIKHVNFHEFKTLLPFTNHTIVICKNKEQYNEQVKGYTNLNEIVYIVEEHKIITEKNNKVRFADQTKVLESIEENAYLEQRYNNLMSLSELEDKSFMFSHYTIDSLIEELNTKMRKKAAFMLGHTKGYIKGFYEDLNGLYLMDNIKSVINEFVTDETIEHWHRQMFNAFWRNCRNTTNEILKNAVDGHNSKSITFKQFETDYDFDYKKVLFEIFTTRFNDVKILIISNLKKNETNTRQGKVRYTFASADDCNKVKEYLDIE